MNYDKYENFNEDYNSQMIKYKLLLESKSQIARMGEIVVSSKEKPIVGTTALATCFGIVFYDRQNKKAYVGHAGPGSYMQMLHTMVSMLDSSTKQIEYSIIPGWDNYNHFGNKSSAVNLLDVDKNPEYSMRVALKSISRINFIPLKLQLDIREGNADGNPYYEFAFDANTLTNVADYLFFETNNLIKKDTNSKYKY